MQINALELKCLEADITVSQTIKRTK